jgi:hypothetical protein
VHWPHEVEEHDDVVQANTADEKVASVHSHADESYGDGDLNPHHYQDGGRVVLDCHCEGVESDFVTWGAIGWQSR